MNKQLYDSGILGKYLFEVDGGLVDNYNASLEKIIGKRTSLKHFRIDKRGLSPEIQEELGDQYLQNGPANRYIIVVSPEQKSASLIREDFSFDNRIIDSLFSRNQAGINAVSRVDSLYTKMDDGLRTYDSLEDVVMLKSIALRLNTPSGFIDKAKELSAMIMTLEGNPKLLIENDSEHVKKLFDLAKSVGDVRKYHVDSMGLSEYINTFNTDLFDGVYVFRDDCLKSKKKGKEFKSIFDDDYVPLKDPSKTSSAELRSRFAFLFDDEPNKGVAPLSTIDQSPATVFYSKNDGFNPTSGPNVTFIPIQKPQEVMTFLLDNGLVKYSKQKVPSLLKRIEDMDMAKQGYVASKMSPEERERVLNLTMAATTKLDRSREWDVVRTIQKSLDKGYELNADLFTRSVPMIVRASLLEVDDTSLDPAISKVVSSLLTRISIPDFTEMYAWNKAHLERVFEGSSDPMKQYILDTLKS